MAGRSRVIADTTAVLPTEQIADAIRDCLPSRGSMVAILPARDWYVLVVDLAANGRYPACIEGLPVANPSKPPFGYVPVTGVMTYYSSAPADGRRMLTSPTVVTGATSASGAGGGRR